VVQVYEVGEQPLPYIAMEFIPGETLQQRLNRVGPVEPAEVVRVGRQIAEGLAAAHADDLIHRDIKPGNILLEGSQHRVKITDFGLARAADDASLSQSGIIAGTPMYMAPEQALGHTLDQRADLFSLGSVLYQMAAGRPPFRANGLLAVLKRVAEDTPRPIREIIPETPQWLCDIIAKLHAKNPDERFQSAREVADVLADCEARLKANAKLTDYSLPGDLTIGSLQDKARTINLIASYMDKAYKNRGDLRYIIDNVSQFQDPDALRVQALQAWEKNELIILDLRAKAEDAIINKQTEAPPPPDYPTVNAVRAPKPPRRHGLIALGDVRRARIVHDRAEADAITIGIVDNGAHIDLSAVIAKKVNVNDKVDGRSFVNVNCPGGVVIFSGKIDGRSEVHVNAPGGRVEFFRKLDGASKVYLVAKDVVLHDKIDYGESLLDVTVTPGGSIAAQDVFAPLIYRKQKPTDPDLPRPTTRQVAYAGKVILQ
jgi:hypothetical protein